MTTWLNKFISSGTLIPDTSWLPYYDVFQSCFHWWVNVIFPGNVIFFALVYHK